MKYIYALLLGLLLLGGCETNSIQNNQPTYEQCQGYIRYGNEIQRCHIPVVPPQTRCQTGLHQ